MKAILGGIACILCVSVAGAQEIKNFLMPGESNELGEYVKSFNAGGSIPIIGVGSDVADGDDCPEGDPTWECNPTWDIVNQPGTVGLVTFSERGASITNITDIELGDRIKAVLEADGDPWTSRGEFRLPDVNRIEEYGNTTREIGEVIRSFSNWEPAGGTNAFVVVGGGNE